MPTRDSLDRRRGIAQQLLRQLKALETGKLDGFSGDRLFDALTREGIPSTTCEMVTTSEANHRESADSAIEAATVAMERLIEALSEGIAALDRAARA